MKVFQHTPAGCSHIENITATSCHSSLRNLRCFTIEKAKHFNPRAIQMIRFLFFWLQNTMIFATNQANSNQGA
uniref:Uncharacterized protein n=1 Tax=Anopheles albimanus TaxID=7167 RepID=A0A182FZC3_ANOAL